MLLLLRLSRRAIVIFACSAPGAALQFWTLYVNVEDGYSTKYLPILISLVADLKGDLYNTFQHCEKVVVLPTPVIILFFSESLRRAIADFLEIRRESASTSHSTLPLF